MADIVVKLGGGVLANHECFGRVLETIVAGARERRLLIVPGGGPFADAVRQADQRLGLTDTAAHWMATLAMDQYAHLLVSRMPGAALVADAPDITRAIASRHLPVLAPSRWLQASDPLPHSWEVTSDSIAAWVAGQLGARTLVMVKPPGVRHLAPDALVDAYFARALPAHVRSVVVAADDIETLAAALTSSK